MFFETLAIASLALRVVAQDSSAIVSSTAASSGTRFPTTTASAVGAQTTVSALGAQGLVASVVSANACETVLAAECNEDTNYICQQASNIGFTEFTYTQSPSAWEYNTATSTAGTSVSISLSCSYHGSSSSITQEVCLIYASVSAPGTSSSSSSKLTATNSAYLTYAQLPITAGAEKLPTGTAASCTSSGNGAAPTGISEVYKVLVPVGAAVIAGAGALF